MENTQLARPPLLIASKILILGIGLQREADLRVEIGISTINGSRCGVLKPKECRKSVQLRWMVVGRHCHRLMGIF